MTRNPIHPHFGRTHDPTGCRRKLSPLAWNYAAFCQYFQRRYTHAIGAPESIALGFSRLSPHSHPINNPRQIELDTEELSMTLFSRLVFTISQQWLPLTRCTRMQAIHFAGTMTPGPPARKPSPEGQSQSANGRQRQVIDAERKPCTMTSSENIALGIPSKVTPPPDTHCGNPVTALPVRHSPSLRPAGNPRRNIADCG